MREKSRGTGLGLGLALGLAFLLGGCGSDGSTKSIPAEVPGDADQPVYLEADPDSAAHAALPAWLPDPEPATAYLAPDSPEFTGLPTHPALLLAQLADGATVGQVNEAVQAVGGSIHGSGADGLVTISLLGESSFERLAQARDNLEAHPAFAVVVEDVLMGADSAGEINWPLPGYSTSSREYTSPLASEWQGSYFGGQGAAAWDRLSPSGNWHLEFVRAPAVWNFRDVLARNLLDGKIPSAIGVLESGLPDSHADLAPSLHNTLMADPGPHGAMVLGLLGAVHRNQLGVAGVHPAPLLAPLLMPRNAKDDGSHAFQVTSSVQVTGLIGALKHSNISVINVSQGLPWNRCLPGCNPQEDPAARRMLDRYATMLKDDLASSGALIVSSAGNDSKGDLGGDGWFLDAKWNAPWTWLALEGLEGKVSDQILVVEAVGWQHSGGRRAAFSNAAGHIAAPGVCVTSTALNDTYASANGTSYATPVVAATAGLLRNLDPSLTAAQVRQIILDTAKPAHIPDRSVIYDGCGTSALPSHPDEPPQPPILDAFAAVMRLEGAPVWLADVDDGTADGLDPGSPSPDTWGDGRIDMADFRAFRDMLLQARGVELPEPESSKRDGNMDGCVHKRGSINCLTPEEIWSRFDFNGDGRLDRYSASPLRLPDEPLTLAAHERTDLGVLQAVWPDDTTLTEGRTAEDLPGLLESGDLWVKLLDWPIESEDRMTFVGFNDPDSVDFALDPGENMAIFTMAEPDCPFASCDEPGVYAELSRPGMIMAARMDLTMEADGRYLPLGGDRKIELPPQVRVEIEPLEPQVGETVTATITLLHPALQVEGHAVGAANLETGCEYRGYSRVGGSNEGCITGIAWTDSTFPDFAGPITYSFVPSAAGRHVIQFHPYWYVGELCLSDPVSCADYLPLSRVELPFAVRPADTPPPEPPAPPSDPPEPPPVVGPSYTIVEEIEWWEVDVTDGNSGSGTNCRRQIHRFGTRPKSPTQADPATTEAFDDLRTIENAGCPTSEEYHRYPTQDWWGSTVEGGIGWLLLGSDCGEYKNFVNTFTRRAKAYRYTCNSDEDCGYDFYRDHWGPRCIIGGF